MDEKEKQGTRMSKGTLFFMDKQVQFSQENENVGAFIHVIEMEIVSRKEDLLKNIPFSFPDIVLK